MKNPAELTDLTVCRGIFAAWVFIYHVDLYIQASAALGPGADLIRHGYLGVDGFFLLSGLILGRVYAPPPAGLRAILVFWGRRLARLYPVHLATLALLGLIVFAGRAAGVAAHDAARFSTLSLAQNLALVQGWGVASAGQWNYPSWSVSTEWAGYLAFPALAWAVAYFEIIVSVQIVITAGLALGLIAYLHGYNLNLAFSAGLLRFFPEFIAGLATARILPKIADIAPLRVLLIAGSGFTILCAALGADFGAIIGLWLALYALAMQADAERQPLLRRATWLRGFGLLSYAFYMSFAVVELVLVRLLGTPADHKAAFVLGMVAGTFALALALHFLIERPARRLIDGWLDAAQPRR